MARFLLWIRVARWSKAAGARSVEAGPLRFHSGCVRRDTFPGPGIRLVQRSGWCALAPRTLGRFARRAVRRKRIRKNEIVGRTQGNKATYKRLISLDRRGKRG